MLAQLTHDGKPNLRVEGDLVPQLDALEIAWQLDGVRVPEETRVEIANALARLN